MKIKSMALVMAISGAAQAAFIQPASVDANSGAIFSSPGVSLPGTSLGAPYELGGLAAYAGSNLIDSTLSDMDETTIIGVENGDPWAAEEGTTQGTLVLDMGQEVNLDSFVLWGIENISSGIAPKDFKLRFYSAAGLQIGSEFSATTALDALPGNQIAPQQFMFSSVYAGVRHVEWEITSNHGDSTYLGAREVGFTETAIPEPATALLMAGFGTVGFAVRRIFMI